MDEEVPVLRDLGAVEAPKGSGSSALPVSPLDAVGVAVWLDGAVTEDVTAANAVVGDVLEKAIADLCGVGLSTEGAARLVSDIERSVVGEFEEDHRRDLQNIVVTHVAHMRGSSELRDSYRGDPARIGAVVTVWQLGSSRGPSRVARSSRSRVASRSAGGGSSDDGEPPPALAGSPWVNGRAAKAVSS